MTLVDRYKYTTTQIYTKPKKYYIELGFKNKNCSKNTTNFFQDIFFNFGDFPLGSDQEGCLQCAHFPYHRRCSAVRPS